MNSIIQEADQQFVSVYNRYPIILDHGEGMYLFTCWSYSQNSFSPL